MEGGGDGSGVDHGLFSHGVGDLCSEVCNLRQVPCRNGFGKVSEELGVRNAPVASASADGGLDIIFGTGLLCAHTEQKGMRRSSIGTLMHGGNPGGHDLHLHAVDSADVGIEIEHL